MSQEQIWSLRQHKRLSRELKDLQSNAEPGWSAESYYPNDLEKWRLYMDGPYGTPYADGKFQLSLTFPFPYPFKVPHFRFDTKIFHPNVDAAGVLCIYHANFTPISTVRSLLQDVMSLIRNPTPEYFINEEVALLLRDNLDLFSQTAIEWTRKYAIDDEIISSLASSFPASSIVSKTAEIIVYSVCIRQLFCLTLKISPATNSPNSLRACSPTSCLWMYRAYSNPGAEPFERWYSYPKDEELAIERVYRSQLSAIELNEKLINFDHGMQLDENGNACPVKRNISKMKRLRRRYRCLAFYNPKNFIEDPIIASCLTSSRNTSISTIVNGIRTEGKLNGKELEAENLVQDLINLNETDIREIGRQCIYLYTCPSFLSGAVNRFLRTRDYSKIDTLGPFCKVLLLQFNKNSSDFENLKVYRGDKLRAHELRAYKRAVGKASYKWLGFTSTSVNQDVAKKRIRNAFFIICLEKMYNDGRALSIKNDSAFDEEDEILLRPGVEFSINQFEYDKDSKIYTFYLSAYI